jgi:hypothetical protein
MEARNSQTDCFRMDNLEERVAPVMLWQVLGGNSDQVSGSNMITTPPDGLGGTISVTTPGTTVNVTPGEGPA